MSASLDSPIRECGPVQNPEFHTRFLVREEPIRDSRRNKMALVVLRAYLARQPKVTECYLLTHTHTRCSLAALSAAVDLSQ